MHSLCVSYVLVFFLSFSQSLSRQPPTVSSSLPFFFIFLGHTSITRKELYRWCFKAFNTAVSYTNHANTICSLFLFTSFQKGNFFSMSQHASRGIAEAVVTSLQVLNGKVKELTLCDCQMVLPVSNLSRWTSDTSVKQDKPVWNKARHKTRHIYAYTSYVYTNITQDTSNLYATRFI